MTLTPFYNDNIQHPSNTLPLGYIDISPRVSIADSVPEMTPDLGAESVETATVVNTPFSCFDDSFGGGGIGGAMIPSQAFDFTNAMAFPVYLQMGTDQFTGLQDDGFTGQSQYYSQAMYSFSQNNFT